MQKICFPRLIYYDQEPLLLLNVTEDYFLGVPRFIGQARICKLVERKKSAWFVFHALSTVTKSHYKIAFNCDRRLFFWVYI